MEHTGVPEHLSRPPVGLSSQSQGTPTTQGGRFAILISGLKSRLVLNSTLHNVVQPAVRLGYKVDLYISLVAARHTVSYSYRGMADPEVMDKSPDDFRASLEAAITSAGAHLALLQQREEQEVVDPLPRDKVLRYLFDYSPYTSEVGMNVLRRWRSSEELLNATLGTSYDFVLWEREDQYWLKPFWLFNFPPYPNAVYAKNCLGWGGMNDKSLLLGREAAHRLLRAYSSFWVVDERLESRNAEQFLAGLAQAEGLSVHKMPWKTMPSSDATFAKREDGSLGLCIKTFYSCKSELPEGSPPFCPDNGGKPK